MSLKHIILIPSLFLLLLSYVLRREAANAIFLVFGLTQPGLKFTIYHTRGEHANHYTTDAVQNGVCIYM